MSGTWCHAAGNQHGRGGRREGRAVKCAFGRGSSGRGALLCRFYVGAAGGRQSQSWRFTGRMQVTALSLEARKRLDRSPAQGASQGRRIQSCGIPVARHPRPATPARQQNQKSQLSVPLAPAQSPLSSALLRLRQRSQAARSLVLPTQDEMESWPPHRKP